MMKQSAIIYNYYQSYYLAKAGIELGLSELTHRGIGFEQSALATGFVAQNFRCGGRCGITVALSGTVTVLSQQFRTNVVTGTSQPSCQTPFVLSSGDTLIIPAFKDSFVGTLANGFSQPIVYKNLYQSLRTSSLVPLASSQVTFGMLVVSGQDLADDGIFFQEGLLRTDAMQQFITAFDTRFRNLLGLPSLGGNIGMYRFFFIISNTSNDPVSFCMLAPDGLPPQQYYLKSQGMYNQQTLGLDSIYKQPIPDFLLNGYLGFN